MSYDKRLHYPVSSQILTEMVIRQLKLHAGLLYKGGPKRSIFGGDVKEIIIVIACTVILVRHDCM